MKKFIFILAILIILAAAGFMFFGAGPTIDDYKNLIEPRLITLPDKKMIIVELRGKPGDIAGKGIGMLYKTIYKLDKKDRVDRNAAPAARWPKSTEVKQEEWVGIFALPVKDSLVALPQGSPAEVKIGTWKYGEVAEILHVGRYDKEVPTVEKLKKFIADKGYAISGDHEEEYVKGPGWIFKGDPEKYLTIIRYQVKKK